MPVFWTVRVNVRWAAPPIHAVQGPVPSTVPWSVTVRRTTSVLGVSVSAPKTSKGWSTALVLSGLDTWSTHGHGTGGMPTIMST